MSNKEIDILDNELKHDGVLMRSGRYPWGSGDRPYQRLESFMGRYSKLKQKGMSDKDIAAAMKTTTTKLRQYYALARAEERAQLAERVWSLKEKGVSNPKIAEMLGIKNESTVRSLIDEKTHARYAQVLGTAEFIKERIKATGKLIDVGAYSEKELGITKTRMDEALALLELEGYEIRKRTVEQATNPGNHTTLKLIGPPGTSKSAPYDDDNIESLRDYTMNEDGQTFDPKFTYPKSINSKRIQVRYKEDGGEDMDGVVELRRGVDDIDLGGSRYSQVRILVDNGYYIKGMAVYGDDLPDGVDVRFNTNKSKGTPMMDGKKGVLKPIGADPANPFNSLIKPGIEDPDNGSLQKGGQRWYYDKNGKKQLSVINKRADEGDWEDWSKKLPSQFLAKQSDDLIKKQLSLTKKITYDEYEEIMNLTNPTVKKKMLRDFADSCDSAAYHLKAAALPRQRYQVILPIPGMKDNEVYAPNFKNGETVALVRFPHGGTFEIPVLKVNNTSKRGQAMMGKNPLDAVGINKKVADQLSGADFDGDTVMVIPCNSSNSKVRISATEPLTGLAGFDPKLEYGGKEPGTFKPMQKSMVQKEMGKISNLITDMTIKGANEPELARAVKHSMVVIDAEKHGLDYRQSAKDNKIHELKKLYQSNPDGKVGGASTLLSLAKSPTYVPKTRGSYEIDPDTGEKKYKLADPYTDWKTGEEKYRTTKVNKMETVRDANELSSGTKVEQAYADYANSMKTLANESRKAILATPNLKYSPEANKKYAAEVESLKAKLTLAQLNKPRERQAQVIADSIVQAQLKADDQLAANKAELKKVKQRAIVEARARVGAERKNVELSESEWKAIQEGAVTDSFLSKLLDASDMDVVKSYATPRKKTVLSSAKIDRIKAMENSGHSIPEIAEALQIPESSVRELFK